MDAPPAPLDPALLRPHYAAFLGPERVLLTGHSHQAWPDVAREGLLASFDDAALHVDDKWGRALERAARVRQGVAERLGATPDRVALGASTHELLVRLLSALELPRRPHLVTTTGEFHSLHRQLSRLAEVGVEVTWVPALPAATLAERLAAAITARTAAVLTSAVLFETSTRVPHLAALEAATTRAGVALVLDAYHAFGVVPWDQGVTRAFVLGGGYKYAQWGEGVCFMVAPEGDASRPVITGWFADFGSLDAPRERSGVAPPPVAYGATAGERFAGSTYDPSSHYRAARVLEFFDAHGLTVERLRALNLRQTARLRAALGERAWLTPEADADRGGFLALRVDDAPGVVRALRARGVWADARGTTLRLGPAPYVTDAELDHAADVLRELLG